MSALSWILLITSLLDIKSIHVGTVKPARVNTTTPAVPIERCQPLKTPFLKEDVAGRNPFSLFREWQNQAKDCGLRHNIMVLSTASRNGYPSVRNVILAGDTTEGFDFYSHTTSLKGRQLEENPVASAMFYYRHTNPGDRQVLITGNVNRLPEVESDAYWDAVSRDYQLLNYLHQGREIRSREIMMTMKSESLKKYQNLEMERPSTWGGYRIRPFVIEFSQATAIFLRDRIVFKKLGPDEIFNPVTMERGVDGWVYYRILP